MGPTSKCVTLMYYKLVLIVRYEMEKKERTITIIKGLCACTHSKQKNMRRYNDAHAHEC